MTGTPATDEPNERLHFVVHATDHTPRKQPRRVRKNLHEPCPDQLDLFDPENLS
ncbi:hypothetical protein [Nocardia sp. NBC_01329]|uniref:hypothetical protein n=1 Tax=Nocardia sp. NBC_01329 TaxID=2903594 RepID=UPI002E14D9A3|nr:hypothetical protein OG405_02635 [Nocardia sp. NBC_01329]